MLFRSPNPTRFVVNALSPAEVVSVRIDEETNTAFIAVPDKQLSLAIGKEGQNARLAARLTGVRIDIRGETEPLGGFDDTEYEEGEWVQNPDTGELEWHAADGTVLTQQQYESGEGAPTEAAPAEAESAPAVADGEDGEIGRAHV